MVIRLVVSEILGCGTTPTDAIEPLKRADAINRYAPIKMFCPQNSSLWGQRKNVCDKKGLGTEKRSEQLAGHWKMKRLKYLIRAGKGRNKVIRRPGHPPKK